MSEDTGRNAKIYEMRTIGHEPYHVIGTRYGITLERARQIAVREWRRNGWPDVGKMMPARGVRRE